MMTRTTFLALAVSLITGQFVQAEDSPHLLLGNPSKATKDHDNKDNFLMTKEWFALSYNNAKGTPNWVSWQLGKEHLGEAPRRQTFATDNHLPQEFHHITHGDYGGGHFDRGHMCPHGDRGGDREMSHATFVMTNVVPQTKELNQKAWNSEEIYLRDLVRKHEHRRLYVVAGPAGLGGGPREAPVKEIGEAHHVAVPSHCWKVAVVVDDVGEHWKDDPEKITPKTRVIAVIMPNDDSPGLVWAKYRVPVRAVEKLTAYTFFDRLPPDVSAALKEKADDEHIPAPVPPHRGKDD